MASFSLPVGPDRRCVVSNRRSVHTAHRFGHAGYSIALSRTQGNVERLAGGLTDENLTDRGYAADVQDRGALAVALEQAAGDLGPVEVLQYSPVPRKEFLRGVLETTVVDLAAAAEFSTSTATR